MKKPIWKGRLIWECKIGIDEIGETELGADLPMRQAVALAFAMVTGKDVDFCFSGWNSKLTRTESKVVHGSKHAMGHKAHYMKIEYYCLNVDCPIQHLEHNEVGWERDAEVAVCPRCGEPMAEVY